MADEMLAVLPCSERSYIDSKRRRMNSTGVKDNGVGRRAEEPIMDREQRHQRPVTRKSVTYHRDEEDEVR